MDFGLFFFASTEDPRRRDKYRLVLDGARFADRHGFSSVWVPERHYSPFGGLYPNPAILHAALARETERIRLRAGSVVLPLHHVLRVAEEWSMVDNLSGGRVDVSVAPGWNPRDFVAFPERWDGRHAAMLEALEELRRLWRGETVPFSAGGEDGELRIYPTPIQDELPVWVTAARSRETFATAGRVGANVLTHLFDHGAEELGEKIAHYRSARAENGHAPETGRVTVMLHTFVGEDVETVRELVREPFCDYIRSLSGLLRVFAKSRGQAVDAGELSAAERDELVGFIFERYFVKRALFGTPESCGELVSRLAAAGVDEIACLLDYGVDEARMLASLPALDELRRRSEGLVPTVATVAVTGKAAGAAAEVVSPSETPDEISDETPDETPSPAAIRDRAAETWDGGELYDRLAARGVAWGAGLRRIERLWRRDGEALAEIVATTGPALLETAFQVLPAALPGDDDALLLPARLGRLDVNTGATVRFLHARTAGEGAEVRFLGADGELLGEIAGLELRRIEGIDGIEATRAASEDAAEAPAPAQRRALAALPPDARRTRLVEELSRRLADVLGLDPEQVDAAAPLHRLGVDSLMAVRLKNRIEAELGLRLSLVALLEGPSLESLAATFAAELEKNADGTAGGTGAADGAGAALPIPRAPEDADDHPASLAQRRLWFLEQFEDDPVYIIPAGLRLSGRLDPAALAAALAVVVERHEALRTVFSEVDGEPRQRILAAPESLVPPCLDLGALAPAAAEAELRRIAREDAERPFDLGRDLLLRPLLLRLGAEDWTLLLTMHHIGSDGWSVGILVREVAALYRARILGEKPALDELPIQYKDFARWQRETLDDGALEVSTDYWRRRFGGGVPDLGRLALEGQAPARPTPRGGRLEAALSPELTRRVAELAKEHGATLFMILLAAFEALLHLEGGGDDFAVGTDSAGRDRAEIEGLIGFFINMVPLRAEVAGDPTFAELLERVRRSTLEAFDHGDLPFERLVEAVQPERGRSGHSPLFRTVFVLQNVPAEVPEMPGLDLELWGFGHETVRFDLSLLVMERDAGPALTWTFRRDRFDAVAVESLSARYAALLEAAVERPERRLDELATWRRADKEERSRRRSGRRSGFKKARPAALAVGGTDEEGD